MTTKILARLEEPFRQYLADERTTDVVVNRPGEVGVKAAGSWQWFDEPWLTYERLDGLSIQLAFNTAKNIDQQHPICETVTSNEERVHICRPDVTARDRFSFSIRRPVWFKPKLAESEFVMVEENPALKALEASAGDYAELLAKAVYTKKNIVVSGPVGVRKTTVTMALIDAIPAHERIITIEDTPEWNDLPHRNRVALYYAKGGQGASKVGAEDLMEATLRMSHDRVLVQELRDGAAYAWMRSIIPHPGSITTVHARSAASAKEALRKMIKQHPKGGTSTDADIMSDLNENIDLIVQMHPEQHGSSYRIQEIYVKGKGLI